MNLTFFKEHKLGLCLVLATWLIFFFPILSGTYAYFLDDLKIIYYPPRNTVRYVSAQLAATGMGK